MIGKKVRVFWPLDEQWYVGTVRQFDHDSGEHLLEYPDGDTEWVRIGDQAGQPGGPPLPRGAGGGDDASASAVPAQDAGGGLNGMQQQQQKGQGHDSGQHHPQPAAMAMGGGMQ